MSKFSWFITAVVFMVAGVIVYNKILFPKETPKGGPGAGGPPKEVTVSGFVAAPRSLSNNIMASGTLLPAEEVELRTEVSGKVVQLPINEGSPVAKGTLLVKLFDQDLQAQLRKLQLQKDAAEKTEQRLRQLLSINGVGQQEYDNALTQLNNILADIDLTKAQISKTEVSAPFAGIVGLRSISNGAYVTPNTIIATLQQTDRLKLDFTIPEKYSTLVRKGDRISFRTDGTEGMFSGTVYAIEPKVEMNTRTVRLRALVQNNGARLFPGTFAKVDLGLKSMDNALMVPTQCIIPEARNKKLIVVKNGKAVFRNVETGVRTESYIQITSGLETGDTVVATGIMYVKPETAIKVGKLVD